MAGKNPGQPPSPGSNKLQFTTPAAGAPAIQGEPKSPTTADVTLNPPPAAGGPYTEYEVEACPIGGPLTMCVKKKCPIALTPTTCPFKNLLPLTTYTVQTQAIKPDGSKTPLSNEGTFTQPGPIP